MKEFNVTPICDREGNLVQYFGFQVSLAPEYDSELWISFDMKGPLVCVELNNQNNVIAEIDLSDLQIENIKAKQFLHKEEEFWNYIYNECKKIAGDKDVSVFSKDIEYGGIAFSLSGDPEQFFLSREEINRQYDLDDYFLEQEERYPEYQ